MEEGLGRSQGSEAGLPCKERDGRKARGQGGQTGGWSGRAPGTAGSEFPTAQGLGHKGHLLSEEDKTLNSVHGPLQLCKEH